MDADEEEEYDDGRSACHIAATTSYLHNLRQSA
jgi:hypothetical protein